MKEKIVEFLKKAQIGEPSSYRNLAVYPIKMQGCGSFPYLVLGEALTQGKVRVSEVGSNGHVPELFVINESGQRVFLMDGEELVGAKQNRILNVSIMLESGSKIKIPVSCVEQGRWHAKGEWMAEGTICYPDLCKEKMMHVTENLKMHHSFASDQSAVWDSVDNKLCSIGAPSQTGSMHDAFKAKGTDIGSYTKNIKFTEGATGVVVVINNRLFCADLFDSSETLRKLWNKLISSYALDAMEWNRNDCVCGPMPCIDIPSFFMEAAKAEFNVFNSPGIGKDVRFNGEGCIGSALVCDDSVIHLAMFKVERRNAKDESSISRPSRRFGIIE